MYIFFYILFQSLTPFPRSSWVRPGEFAILQQELEDDESEEMEMDITVDEDGRICNQQGTFQQHVCLMFESSFLVAAPTCPKQTGCFHFNQCCFH